jgi:hypothetical protein
VALREVTYGLSGLAQRVDPVDDGCELAGLYQILEPQEVLPTLRGYEAEHLLPCEARTHRSEDLALKAP